MSKPSLDIIRSPTAQEMLQMVTQGFYDKSYIGLWLFEVIGREYDDMAIWAEEIKREAFVQTCTWSISIYEWLADISPNPSMTLEQRRARVLAKQLQRPPINPAQVAGIISAFTGCPVTITDPIKPYRFKVEVDESHATIPVDYKAARKILDEVKPSHLAAEWTTIITADFTGEQYEAGATAVLVTEFFTDDETPIETAVFDACAGVSTEVVQEYLIGDNAPISTKIGVFDAGAEMEYLKEFYEESFPTNETAESNDGGADFEIITEVFTE